ncbi:MAG: DNA adenine methylase [Pseudanabaenaceae cyanobacterium]|jgi:DNA adenine methylase
MVTQTLISTDSIATPFVKWVGGKRALMPELIAHLPPKFDPQVNSYYEPFLGGGALFFALQSRASGLINANLSDTNLELVLTYITVRDNPQELIERLKQHQANHSKEYYYQIRSQHNLQSPLDVAARFIYLNKTCYNGLYRVNSKGAFNVPMGSYKDTSAIVQEGNIFACSRALQNVNINHYQFEKINIQKTSPKSGDFIYFDPPYHPTDELSFTRYAKLDFTEKNQEDLRDFAAKLSKKGVYVMISNSETGFIKSLYQRKPFKISLVSAPRFVNCKANKRGNVGEVLITNY